MRLTVWKISREPVSCGAPPSMLAARAVGGLARGLVLGQLHTRALVSCVEGHHHAPVAWIRPWARLRLLACRMLNALGTRWPLILPRAKWMWTIRKRLASARAKLLFSMRSVRMFLVSVSVPRK